MLLKLQKNFLQLVYQILQYKFGIINHLKFKNHDTSFPYVFFGKPKMIKKFSIASQKKYLKKPLNLIQDILSLNEYKKKIHFIKNELEKGNAYQINFTTPR